MGRLQELSPFSPKSSFLPNREGKKGYFLQKMIETFHYAFLQLSPRKSTQAIQRKKYTPYI